MLPDLNKGSSQVFYVLLSVIIWFEVRFSNVLLDLFINSVPLIWVPLLYVPLLFRDYLSSPQASHENIKLQQKIS